MKKNFLALMLAVAVATLPSVAQNADNTNTTCEKACKKESKATAHRGVHRKAVNPFEGLNLSDEQKAQLKALGEKRMQQRKEQARHAAEKRHANDSLMQVQRAADRKAYLDEVKVILGDEQYVLFLENQYIKSADNAMKAQRYAKGDKMRNDKKGEKGGKMHKKGEPKRPHPQPREKAQN